jgi:hypothetical protein
MEERTEVPPDTPLFDRGYGRCDPTDECLPDNAIDCMHCHDMLALKGINLFGIRRGQAIIQQAITHFSAGDRTCISSRDGFGMERS